jgi:hypothetical protein
MKITEIIYHRTFNLGNFNSERIGVKVDINEGESASEALETAKQLVEETNKNNYPNLVIEPQVEQVLSKEEITEGNIKAIMDCKTLDELETCKLLCKQGKDEFHAFNVRKKQLQ